MKKSLYNRYDRYVITSSSAVSPLIRWRDRILTLILWAIYLYWMQDFFIFMGKIILWVSGLAGHKLGLCTTGCPNTLVSADSKILDTLLVYFEVIYTMGATLIVWALYNRMRFRGKSRRKNSLKIGVHDIATMYHRPEEDIEAWQKARVMVMHHDQRGRLVSVDVTKPRRSQ